MLGRATQIQKTRVAKYNNPTQRKINIQNTDTIRQKEQPNCLNISKKCGKTRITPINADSLRTQGSFQRLTMMPTEERIDIECIQKTHNERADAQVQIRILSSMAQRHQP